MKQGIAITVIILFFFSCSHSPGNLKAAGKAGLQNQPVLKPVDLNSILKADSFVYTAGNGPITSLPFGLNEETGKLDTAGIFYSKLVYNNIGKLINEGWTPRNLKAVKIYKLPPIKKITYIGISDVDTGKCKNGRSFGDYLKLPGYRYRLPDVKNYQCFYWCTYDPNTLQYPDTLKQLCNKCIINEFYGYLIFYDKATMECKVVTIYYNTFRDGKDFNRHFYIDKKQDVYLTDFSQEANYGDESVPTMVSVDSRHRVSVAADGTIAVKPVE